MPRRQREAASFMKQEGGPHRHFADSAVLDISLQGWERETPAAPAICTAGFCYSCSPFPIVFSSHINSAFKALRLTSSAAPSLPSTSPPLCYGWYSPKDLRYFSVCEILRVTWFYCYQGSQHCVFICLLMLYYKNLAKKKKFHRETNQTPS